MAVKRLTGDLARTTVGLNPGVDIPGAGATQVIGLTDWAMTIKTKSLDASTTDDDAWEDWLPSMSSWTAKAKFCYLMGEPSQMANIIQATIGTGRRTSSEWNFFLDSESGDDSFSGQAFISGLGISSIIGRTITMDVTLQGRGPLNLRNLSSFLGSLVLPTGSLGYTISRPLGNNSFQAMWSNFALASLLPADATILGIYPVAIASANYDGAFQYLQYGTDVVFGGNIYTSFRSPSPAPLGVTGATFTSTEFYDVSIGASLSALVGQKIQAMLQSSLLVDVRTDLFTITGVGFAIEYASAVPVIDPLMPPPFTIAGGHGLAWALPFTCLQSGGPFNNGEGLLSPSSGFGFGTPAKAVE